MAHNVIALHAIAPTDSDYEASYAHLEQAHEDNESARLKLLLHVLPISFLTCGDLSVPASVKSVLCRLRANLCLVPAIYKATQSLIRATSNAEQHEQHDMLCDSQLQHLLAARCDADDLNSTHVLLAQRAAQTADQLVNAWNSLVLTDPVSSVNNLPSAILAIRQRTQRTRALTAQVDVAINNAARVANMVVHDATRIAISAVDDDTAERTALGGNGNAHDLDRTSDTSPQTACDISRVVMLEQRGQTISAKLNRIRAQVAARMYTDEHVQELSLISEAVRERIVVVDDQLRKRATLLAQYRALGPEFENVVEEYLSVKGRMEQLLWSKKELGLG